MESEKRGIQNKVPALLELGVQTDSKPTWTYSALKAAKCDGDKTACASCLPVRKPFVRVKTLGVIQRARPQAGCSPHRGWPGQKHEEARGLRSQPGLYTGRIQGWASVS